MKIKPSDHSVPVPPDPERAGRKEDREFTVEQSSVEEKGSIAKTKKSEVALALEGVKDQEEIVNRFVDLTLKGFEGSVAPVVLDAVRGMLQEQMQEDPYLQSKLERISGLLPKAK